LSILFVSGWAFGADPLGLSEFLQENGLEKPRCFSATSEDGTSAKALGERVSPFISSQTILMGWSMGASLVLDLLAKEKIERPKKILLFAPTARFLSAGDYWLPEGSDSKIDAGRSDEALSRLESDVAENPGLAVRNLALSSGLKPSEFESGELGLGSWTKDQLLAGLKYLRETDLRSNLESLRLPCLIVQCGKDRVVNPVDSMFLHEKIKGSELLQLTKQKHFVNLRSNNISSEGLGSILSFLQ